MTIRVAGDHDFAPYEFVDNGVPTGFNVELFKAVATVMGQHIETKLSPWNTAKAQLLSGEVDVLTGMYYSDRRTDLFSFSVPHVIVFYDFFVRKESGIQDLFGLRGASILVQRDDLMEEYLRKLVEPDQITTVVDASEALRLVSLGKYQAAFVAKLHGLHVIDQYGLSNLQPIGFRTEPVAYCFAVRKGNESLIAELDEGLNILKATGRYRQIYDKWFGMTEQGERWPWIRSLAISVFVFAALLAASLAWNYSLNTRVRRQTAELRQIVNLVPHPIFARDARGYFLLANQAYATLLGKEVDELLGKSFLDLADDRDMALKSLEQDRIVLSTGIPFFVLNQTIRLRDTSTRICEVSRIPFRSSRTGLPAVLGILVDVTERHSTEQALRRSETRYRALFESATDGIALFRDKHVIDCNPQVLRLLGLSREKVVGRSVLDFAPAGDADFPAKVESLRETVWAGETPVFEWDYQREDGTFLYAEISASLVNTGDESFSLVFLHDVTDRKRIERALRDSERRLADIIDFLPDATFAIDLDGRVIAWNHAIERMTGIKAAAILGKDHYEHSLPFYRERCPMLIDFVLNPSLPSETTLVYSWINENTALGESFSPALGSDGVNLWAMASVLFDASGKQAGAIESVRDISALRRAETELREVNAQLSRNEEALRDSQARLTAAIESLPFDVWMCDSEGRYILQNRKSIEIWGNAIGKDSTELDVPEEIRAHWHENNTRAYQGEVIQGEIVYTHGADTRYIQEIIASIRAEDKILGMKFPPFFGQWLSKDWLA